MENLNSTHLYVTANSYPILLSGYQALSKEKVSPAVLSHLLTSPLYTIPVRKISSLAQTYVQDASLINLSLNKSKKVVKILEEIDYDQLNDTQRSRIISLSREVDQIDFLLRGEIFNELNGLHKELHTKLKNQIDYNNEYIKSLGTCLDERLAYVSKALKMDIEWTQGKAIVHWDQVDAWLSRYGEVDRSSIYVFRKEGVSPQEDLDNLFKTIILAEVLIAYGLDAKINKGMLSSTLGEKAIKLCRKMPVALPVLKEEDAISISLYEHTSEIHKAINKLLEEILEYPAKSQELGEKQQKDFKKRTSKQIKYSEVIVNDDLREG
ncbi:hypothetical protein OAT84_02260 [Gammaproteobacteria bacterium]|nr:hypothetical protein [Gammaproteobacteria bacterium]